MQIQNKSEEDLQIQKNLQKMKNFLTYRVYLNKKIYHHINILFENIPRK